MHLGSEYQVRVAAWLAVEMLAEGQGRPFAPGGRISLLRGETQESVDDLLVGTVRRPLRVHSGKAKGVILRAGRTAISFQSSIRQYVRWRHETMTATCVRGVDHSRHQPTVYYSSQFCQSGNNINVLLRDVLNRAVRPCSGSAVHRCRRNPGRKEDSRGD